MDESLHTGLVSRVLEKGREIANFDGWLNVALGYGTSRDKTIQGMFANGVKLQDEELRSLYAHDHIAAKIVNVYPREAMREGYELAGLDKDILEKVNKYLEYYNCKELVTDSAIWARLFGGGAAWALTDDGANPAQPLVGPPKKVVTFKFYDRRWLTPWTWYESGPKVGQVQQYMLTSLTGQTAKIGVIHETRLVLFPGARTEVLAKRELNSWDYSVLQAVYDAVRSSGNVWKSIELLIADANQGIFRIKNLWKMFGGARGEELKSRVSLMDLTRSVARSILIDKDDEDFTRTTTTFAGLADLDDRTMRRVASAAEVPISLIGGEQPKGLNASGDSELTWFWARVAAYQVQELEPRILQIYRLILGQADSPLRPEQLEELKLKWHPLWSPTAKEKAEIDKLKADTADVAIKAEMVLPEEAALSIYGGEEPGLITIDTKAREKILAGDMQALLKPPEPDPAQLPPGQTPTKKQPPPAE